MLFRHIMRASLSENIISNDIANIWQPYHTKAYVYLHNAKVQPLSLMTQINVPAGLLGSGINHSFVCIYNKVWSVLLQREHHRCYCYFHPTWAILYWPIGAIKYKNIKQGDKVRLLGCQHACRFRKKNSNKAPKTVLKSRSSRYSHFKSTCIYQSCEQKS